MGEYISTRFSPSSTSADWRFRSTGQRISFRSLELDSVNLTARLSIERCSVEAELPGIFPAQERGSTETVSEAAGANGIHSHCQPTQIASYETASVLAS